MNYQQFLAIWPEIFAIFTTISDIHPPDISLGLNTHWKYYHNFTESKIYGENGELIGTEKCYFILPCNEYGEPLTTPNILLREWRDIRQYLSPTTSH